MADIPQSIYDGFVAAGVDLNRVEAGLRRDVLLLLLQMEKEVVNQLVNAPNITSWRSSRLRDLAAAVRTIIINNGGKIAKDLDKKLSDLAIAQAQVAVNVLNTAIGVDVAKIGVSQDTLTAIAKNTLIQGAPSEEWWSAQQSKLLNNFVQQVRMGVTLGENNEQIVRRIRGTKALNYTDGIMEISRSHARTLVRTSVQSVANAAREEVYNRNSELFKGIQWVATLDMRTTQICRGLDGKMWTLPDYQPIGHGIPFPGRTAHWNCRSTQVPVMKSFADLAGANANADFVAALDNMPESTRSSLDGQVSESMDYDQWLKTQSAADQLKVLGPSKYRLWKEQKISMADMIDESGRPMKVEELLQKYKK